MNLDLPPRERAPQVFLILCLVLLAACGAVMTGTLRYGISPVDNARNQCHNSARGAGPEGSRSASVERAK